MAAKKKDNNDGVGKERICYEKREMPTRPSYRSCYPERRPKQRQLDSKLYYGDLMTAADKRKFIT